MIGSPVGYPIGGGISFGNRSLQADVGAFSLVGQNVALGSSNNIIIEKASFSLTGNAVTFIRTNPPIVKADFSLVGQNTNLLFGHRVAAAAAAFILAGQNNVLRRSLRIVVAPAAFALSGIAVSTEHGRRVAAETGVFTIAGGVVNFIRTNPKIDPASFTLSGVSQRLLYGRLLHAQAGAFALAGQASVFRYSKSLNANAGDTDIQFLATDYIEDVTSNILSDVDLGAEAADRIIVFVLSTSSAGLDFGPTPSIEIDGIPAIRLLGSVVIQ